jgi:conjugative transfer region protein TrbK
MRGRTHNFGRVSRVVGFAAVTAAIIATGLHLRHDDASVQGPSAGAVTSIPSDSLARELVRCRAIGMAAKDDIACGAAWAENRRRFFTYQTTERAPPASSAADQPPAAPPEDK